MTQADEPTDVVDEVTATTSPEARTAAEPEAASTAESEAPTATNGSSSMAAATSSTARARRSASADGTKKAPARPRKRATTGRSAAPKKPPARRATDGERIGVSRAVRLHWRLALAPVAALLLLAFLIALVRPPTYTASARLTVGGVELPSQSIQNFVGGTQALAATYSRVVNADSVVQPVAQKLGLEPGDVSSRLAGSPVPESSIFFIEAKGDSAGQAVSLANEATTSLITFVRRSSTSDTRSEEILTRVREAAQEVQRAEATQARQDAAFEVNPSSQNELAAAEASGNVQAARLKLETFKSIYEEAQQGLIGTTNVVQILNPADGAASDRGSVLQRLLFIGLIGGLAIGATLAMLRANTLRRLGQE